MQATFPERSHPAQSAVVSLATLTALALLGLVLAYWTWAWLAPHPEPRAQPAAQADGLAVDAGQKDAYRLFGGARRDGNGAAPATGAIKLLGIVAASGGRPGYAVLRLNAAQTVALVQGAEIEPGLRLVEVHVDHVVLERSGGRETLAWPQKAGK